MPADRGMRQRAEKQKVESRNTLQLFSMLTFDFVISPLMGPGVHPELTGRENIFLNEE
jgi:hypothetical protein